MDSESLSVYFGRMRFEQVYQAISSRSPLTAEEWMQFEPTFKSRKVAKGEVLVVPGEIPDSVYFVLSGVLRNYFVIDSGREFTKSFRGPGSLMGPYSELLTKIKTRYFIKATVESNVMEFSYAGFAQMMDQSKSWERVGRVFAEMNYLEKERREYMLMSMDIKEKYEDFLKEFSPYLADIPQVQIASYLGVTAEALSRFLNKK